MRLGQGLQAPALRFDALLQACHLRQTPAHGVDALGPGAVEIVVIDQDAADGGRILLIEHDLQIAVAAHDVSRQQLAAQEFFLAFQIPAGRLVASTQVLQFFAEGGQLPARAAQLAAQTSDGLFGLLQFPAQGLLAAAALIQRIAQGLDLPAQALQLGLVGRSIA